MMPMTLSRVQPYSGAEPTAARFRPGTASGKALSLSRAQTRLSLEMFAKVNGPLKFNVHRRVGLGSGEQT